MNKEVNLLTDSQIKDVVESLKVNITTRDFKKEDHIMRKYYNICDKLRRIDIMQEFVEYLEQHPVESKMFTLMLWNGLVDSCENILATYKKPEEYKIGAVRTDSKNNKYAHVLNDLLSSMLEEDEYYTIQAEALNYAIDKITCEEVDTCAIDKLKKEVLSDPNLKAQYEKETEIYDAARYLKKTRAEKGLSIIDVAEQAGLTPEIISNIEAYNGNVTRDECVKYCNAIGIELPEVFQLLNHDN